MKKITLILISFLMVGISKAQHLPINLNYSLGFDSDGQKFTYDDKNIGHYSLGWYQVSGSAEARLSSHGGIRFFTQATPRLSISQFGNVGIGVINPSVKLDIYGKVKTVFYPLYENYEQTNIGSYTFLQPNFSEVTTPEIKSYDIGMYSNINYNIPSGVYDTGYKIGMYGNAISEVSTFAGTLKSNYGIWARSGIHYASSGAKIEESVGLYAQVILRGGTGTTVNNAYGVKILSDYNSSTPTIVGNKYDLFAGTPDAKNYFAGNVGIATTNPEGNLQVGNSTKHGMIFLGGGKGYSGIGSTRSDGGLALGCNIYSRYDGEEDDKVARVSKGNSNGFSGIKLSRDGEIDFFGKQGVVVFDNIANSNENIKMRIAKDGNIAMGTLTTSDATGVYKLSVKGKVRASEVKVYTGWADFVFEKDYNLPTLQEVEQHIKQKGHLKDIPNAKQVEDNGIYLGAMNAKLLQKIEELTLYTIQQEKDIKSLNSVKVQNEELKQRVDKLEKLVEKLIEN